MDHEISQQAREFLRTYVNDNRKLTTDWLDDSANAEKSELGAESPNEPNQPIANQLRHSAVNLAQSRGADREAPSQSLRLFYAAQSLP